MIMRNFITCFLEIIVILIFLQHHLAASSSPIKQKNALFRFKRSLNIGTPTNCHESYQRCQETKLCRKLMNYEIRSHPKTKNWSMSSDHCTWEGVTCDLKTGDVIGLDLSCSQLEGAILPNSTLFQLSHLRFLNLSHNDFSLSNQFPQEFGFFATGLTHLNLSNTGLHGVLPQEVFHLPNLEVLALGDDITLLQAVLPKVKWGSSGSLQHLFLQDIDIYGSIPDSIGFLESLTTLELPYCNLNGPIPSLLANLTNLRQLSLYSNNFTGPLPLWLFKYPSLEELYLSDNGFTGQLFEFDSSKSRLMYFDCRNNSLSGSIPQSFSQLLNLTFLDLSSNNFSGPIPQSFSQLLNLTFLDFSSNNFSGVLDFEIFSGLEHLDTLDLSHNSLSVRSTSMATLPTKLYSLKLASCNLKEFPHFSRDAEISLDLVDLSNNEIDGEIPYWIGSVGSYLNISHNRLTGSLEQLPWKNIRFLDLQSNKLNGSLPTLICNSSSLEVLNLSHNTLSGVLPICRTNLTNLSVFDLRMNNIEGNLPSTLSNFHNLVSLNLHGNKIEGRIPFSFSEFEKLETLDLGSNQISDTFPLCLEALPSLQVLVLKSNKFHGLINKWHKTKHPFPSLRIIDLSNNEFSGPLPTTYIRNFKAMMNGDVNKIKPSYMGDSYYSDSMSLVIKGVEIEFVRILNVFTAIDVSRNNFEGEIDDCIGNLVSLRHLNISHNLITGHIPSLIGKLSMLESLDLSFNQFEGEIPQQLTGIYSLARLNLSCNQLSGHIPRGSQFNTFDNDSYVGNLGLCGFPLSKACEHDIGTQHEGEGDDYFFSGFTWEAVVIGYGCGVVPAFIIGYLMLLSGKPKWFSGIIARELGLKMKRMEINLR